MLKRSMTMAHHLILETSCLLEDPSFFLDYDLLPDYTVWIPKPVLQELGDLKRSGGPVGQRAQSATRQLETILTTSGGQPLPNCTILVDEETESLIGQTADQALRDRLFALQSDGTFTSRTLAVTLFLQERLGKETVMLVSLDSDVRIRAQAHGIATLDPAGWLTVGHNTWAMAMAARGLKWTQQGNSFYRIPVDMDELGEGLIEIWPFWGYESGLFSTLHIRLFEPGSDGSDGRASKVLILSPIPRIHYEGQMAANQVPCEIFVARTGAIGTVRHREWELWVTVKDCHVLREPIRVPDTTGQVITDLGVGLAHRGPTRTVSWGRAVGTLLATSMVKSRIVPAFSELSLVVSVSKAPAADEIAETPQAQSIEFIPLESGQLGRPTSLVEEKPQRSLEEIDNELADAKSELERLLEKRASRQRHVLLRVALVGFVSGFVVMLIASITAVSSAVSYSHDTPFSTSTVVLSGIGLVTAAEAAAWVAMLVLGRADRATPLSWAAALVSSLVLIVSLPSLGLLMFVVPVQTPAICVCSGTALWFHAVLVLCGFATQMWSVQSEVGACERKIARLMVEKEQLSEEITTPL